MRYIRYLATLILLALLSIWILASTYGDARNSAVEQLYIQEDILAKQAANGIQTYFSYLDESTAYLAKDIHVVSLDNEGIQKIKDFSLAHEGDVSSVTRVSERGIVLYSYPDETVIGRDISSQAHVAELLSTQKPVLSNVFTAVQGYRAIAFHYPLFEDGRFRGSIGLLIPFEKLSKRFVESIKIGQAGYGLLINSDGTILYSPDSKQTGQSLMEISKDNPKLYQLAQKAVRGEVSQGTYEYPGDGGAVVTKHASFRPVPIQNTFWSVVVTAPEEEALVFIKDFRDRWVLGIGFLLLVFLVWAYSLGRAYLSMHRESMQGRVDLAERERWNALAVLNTAIMQSPSGIVLASAPDVVIRMANPAVLKIRGRADQEVANMPVEQFIGDWKAFKPDGTVYSPHDLPLTRAITTGQTIRAEELIIYRENGEKLWLSVNAAPVLDQAGKIAAGIMIFEDITERKKAEETLNDLNQELERRVRLRTREMEIANKELESFAYSVSHDLRAPLRSIDGYSHLLLESSEEQLGEVGQHYLNRIILSVKQMGELIDGLLTFSRLGRKAIKFQKICSDEMQSMVEGVIADVRAADESRQVEWLVGDLDEGVGDLLLVHQVWTNLLANAFKYSRECSRPKIEIGSTETPRGRAYFVRDNGIGFDMQYVEKIFGVFQRLNRTEEYEGTGIGLALVKRIIDRHGGQVWAESRLNQGSTFYFTLGEN